MRPEQIDYSSPRAIAPFKQARVQREENGVLSLTGALVSYGERNRNGWLHLPGAFYDSVQSRPSTDLPLPMGYEHSLFSAYKTIGKWTQATDSEAGVAGTGRISDTADGRDAATLLEDECLNGISIGFDPVSWEDVYVLGPGEQMAWETRYGTYKYKAEDWTICFGQSDLLEASIVAIPADDNGRVKSLTQSMQRAGRALPGLTQDAGWPDVAYSMALLLGGRGHGQAFEDMPPLERLSLYSKLAQRYTELGKTAPPYDAEPEYSKVAFHHDERDVFQDRYLRKTIATLVAGAGGFQGQLSPETRDEALGAIDALQTLVRHEHIEQGAADQLGALAARVRSLTTTPKG